MKVVQYLRADGPICFEVNLFGDQDLLRRLSIDLFASGLSWYWASARSRPVENHEFIDRPSKALLTPIDQESVSQSVDDFRERDVDGYGRSILLLGSDLSNEFQSRQALDVALDEFSKREAGPLRIIVIQVGDSPEYFFVPHRPNESVVRLLEIWGIDSSLVTETLPYDRLNLVKLELLKESVLNLAFGNSQ